MERLIMDDLLKWKDKPYRKPLLFTGVRQCGKTYILKEFGRRYFEDVAYFNFEENENIASLFEYDLNVNRILDELGSVVRGKPITPGKTLVIFDEVQKSGRAVTSLKYFCENMPELHLVAAGSLLGVALKRDEVSYPVGKTDELQLYPMTFEEYVMADGGAQLLEGLKKIERLAFANCISLIEIKFVGVRKDWVAVTKDQDWDKNAGPFILRFSE